MKAQRTTEVVVGLFMVAAFAALLVLAFWVSGLASIGSGGTYKVYAEFDNIGGLKVRAPVAIAGVTVGRVSNIVLDPETFYAKVTITLEDKFHNLPLDSSASILTQGLLGANYISLTPGGDQESLKPGGTIFTTHSALILENVIGQLIYNIKNGDKDKKTTDEEKPVSTIPDIKKHQDIKK